MFSKRQRVLWGLVFLAGFLFPTTYLAVQSSDEIRIDVPADVRIKVRNDFGSVSVETSNNSYVAVSATFEGAAKFTRSPIVLDNRGKLVMISVVRRPIDPVVAIHLRLKVPAKVQVVNDKGDVLVAQTPEMEASAPPEKPELIG